MATLYLHPGASGSNSGTETDPFTSWAGCASYLNANHANLVTDEEGVDVIVRGAMETISSSVSFTSVSNDDYPLRFIADEAERLPGTYNTDAPGIILTYASPAPLVFNSASSFHVELIGLNVGTIPGASASRREGVTITAGSASKLILDKCYFKGAQNTGSGTRAVVYNDNANVITDVFNCIAEGFTTTGGANRLLTDNRNNVAGTRHAANNTFVNMPNGAIHRNATAIWVYTNNLYVNTPADSGASSDSAHNATTAESGLPGSNATYNVEPTDLFVSEIDYHLAAHNDWGAGPDVAVIGDRVPLFDIDGNERTGVVTDAGADLFAGDGGITLTSGETFDITPTSRRLRVTTDTGGGEIAFALYPGGEAPDPEGPDTPAAIFALAIHVVGVTEEGVVESPAFEGLTPNTTYDYAIVQRVEDEVGP